MKSGNIDKPKEIFKTSINKTTVMMNSFLEGLLQCFCIILSIIFYCNSLGLVNNNYHEEALELFKKTNISKNEYSYSILFKICTKIGNESSFKFGRMSFEQMPNKFKTNDVVLTSALQMFVKCNDMSKAEQLFIQMKKNPFAYSIMMNSKNIELILFS